MAGEPLPGRTVQGAHLKIMKFNLPMACSVVTPSSGSPAPGSSRANTGVRAHVRSSVRPAPRPCTALLPAPQGWVM